MTLYTFSRRIFVIACILYAYTNANSTNNNRNPDEDDADLIGNNKIFNISIDQGTWQVDKIGKDVLDGAEAPGYLCPCTKAEYESSTNATKSNQSVSGSTQKSHVKREGGGGFKSSTGNGNGNDIERTTFKIIEGSHTKYSKGFDNTVFNTSTTSCAAIHNYKYVPGHNGVHTISLPASKPFKVRCEADVGMRCSWTVVLERKHKQDNFDHDWQQYRIGFGNPELGESYFVGLDNLYALTDFEDQELAFSTKFQQEDLKMEMYDYFRIGPESTGYKVLDLNVQSNVRMVRRLVRDATFSTKDKRVGRGYMKCAERLEMGWWYSPSCKQSTKLNSVRAYIKSPTIMAIRPRDCKVAPIVH